MTSAALNPGTNDNTAWRYIPAADAGIANTTAVVLVAARGPGKLISLKEIYLGNVSATATVVQVLSATTVIGRFTVPANAAGLRFQLDPPIRTAANEALSVQCGTTGSGVLVNASGT